MAGALAMCGVDEGMIQKVYSAIDKRDKMQKDAWEEHILPGLRRR